MKRSHLSRFSANRVHVKGGGLDKRIMSESDIFSYRKRLRPSDEHFAHMFGVMWGEEEGGGQARIETIDRRAALIRQLEDMTFNVDIRFIIHVTTQNNTRIFAVKNPATQKYHLVSFDNKTETIQRSIAYRDLFTANDRFNNKVVRWMECDEENANKIRLSLKSSN